MNLRRHPSRCCMLHLTHKTLRLAPLETMANPASHCSQWLLKLFLTPPHPRLLQNPLIHLMHPITTLPKALNAPHAGSSMNRSPFYGLSFHSCLMSATADSTFRKYGRTHKKEHHSNIGGCCQAFSYAKDLRRHRTAKHGIGDKVYCTVHDCKWSQKGFSRLDILAKASEKRTWQ